jgi:Flp pilus assembly protein TadG
MRKLPLTKRDLSPEHERGQSLVELALVFVLLLWLVSVILDLGRAYYVIVALENAAEEGAAYASIDPACLQEGESTDCDDPDNAVWRARHENPGGMLSPDLITVNFTSASASPAPGDAITVHASYPYEVMTPLGGTVLGTDTITLTGSATRIVLLASSSE